MPRVIYGGSSSPSKAELSEASGGSKSASARRGVDAVYRHTHISRILALACLGALSLVEGGYRGSRTLAGITLLLVWPYFVRFGVAPVFPSRSVAELFVILDFIVVSGVCLALGGGQITLALMLVMMHANSLIIGGPRLLAWAYAVVAPAFAVVYYAGVLPVLRGPVSAPAAIGGLGMLTLYVSAVAGFSWRVAKQSAQRKNALKELSANLESLVAIRTAALASTNVAISRFVPQEFLRALGHDDVTTAKLGDAVVREVTVLFADIRNFTSLSERMSPEDTFRFLNGCFSRIGPHIRAQSGFVDKYIGDGIMALFSGSPSDAVHAALAMQREIRSQNEANADGTPLAIGIGIHMGRVMMGTIGEEQRFEATVISDAVNLTARLESLTKQLGCAVLISADVAKHLPAEELLLTRPVGTFAVKGKSHAVGLVEVFAADDDELRDAKAASSVPFARALEHYKQGEIAEALAIVRGLSAMAPRDGPVAWWLTRIEKDLTFDGPPGGREVVRLDEK